jgi:cyclic pyranopterin phosphate synthase
LDLRAILRGHPGDGARLEQGIREAMQIKPKGHEFDLRAQPIIFRHMNLTGG